MASIEQMLKLNLPVVDMNLQHFEEFIRQRGLMVSWEKAAMCPCVRADTTSGRPTFNCQFCYNGNRYVDRKEIIAAITNITGQRNAQVYGDLNMGGIYVTVSGEHRVGINDRIILLDQTARYAELCELPVVKTKAPANPGDATMTLENTRKLPVPESGFAVLEVAGQRIRYTGKTPTTVTGIPSTGAGSISAPIASNTDVTVTEYVLRYPPIRVFDCRTQTAELKHLEDFDLVDGRRLRFRPGKTQTAFTILYDSRPVYLVDQLSHEFRDQRLRVGLPQETLGRFPLAFVARKDFLNKTG